jgi:hypothetical protein
MGNAFAASLLGFAEREGVGELARIVERKPLPLFTEYGEGGGLPQTISPC